MKKRLSILLGILQLFVAIGALPAGYSMMVEPDGGGLGMSPALLEGSLFHSFLIPGIFLFTVNGILNLAAAFFSFRKAWFAGYLAMLLGIAMLIWISVQIASVGLSSVLQPLYFIIGCVEIYMGWRWIRLAKHEKGSN